MYKDDPASNQEIEEQDIALCMEYAKNNDPEGRSHEYYMSTTTGKPAGYMMGTYLL